jgi:hypothetical protein
VVETLSSNPQPGAVVQSRTMCAPIVPQMQQQAADIFASAVAQGVL